MKIGVTGGTGCLGKPLIKKLVEENRYIKLLVLHNEIIDKNYYRGMQIIRGDLFCHEVLDALTKECDTIYHLAGKVHSDPTNYAEEQEFYQINVEGTKNLLKVSRKNKVKRVIFYSTVGVYGLDADFHGDEFSSCNPKSAYAKSKYLAEQLILNHVKDGGPEGVVLRFPVVYGPSDRGNVAKLIKAIHDGIFFYFGDGKSLRSMISSTNAAEAAIRASSTPEAASELFCVTDGRDYTVQEIVETICQTLGTSKKQRHLPLFVAQSFGMVGDSVRKLLRAKFPIDSDKVRKLSRPLTFSCEKAKQLLGYMPVETLAEGIFKEVAWLRKKEGWK